MDRSSSKSAERARRVEIVTAVRGQGEPRTAQIAASPLLVRLASKLGIPIEALALRISPDTVRRTKYPALEEANEDGTTSYKAPVQVIEGPISR